MNFAQNLKKLLDDNHKTMYWLSKMLKVHPTTVSNWINGKTEPKGEILAKIAEYFGVSISDLMGVEPARSVDPNETTEEREKRHGMEPGTFRRLLTPEQAKALENIKESFYDLNNAGKREAEKRIGELVQLKQYNKAETPDPPAGYFIRDDYDTDKK